MKGTTLAVVYKKAITALYKALNKSSALVTLLSKTVRKYHVFSRGRVQKNVKLIRKQIYLSIRSTLQKLFQVNQIVVHEIQQYDHEVERPTWHITRSTSHAHQKIVLHGSLMFTAALVAVAIAGLYTAPKIMTKVVEITMKITPTPMVTQAPSPTPTPDLVAQMSPADRIGQLFMIRVAGDTLTDETKQYITRVQPGGVVLMRDNISDISGTKALVDDLQMLVHHKLFIAVDQEGGTVLRLPWDENTSIAGDHTAALTKIDANTNLAPILDRAVDGGYIHDRAYATDSATIIRKSQEVIDAQKKMDIISVGKHFPGIGRATEDPHARIAQINAYAQELEDDIAPFEQLKDKLEMVMSSHVRYSALDGANPATFSYQIMTDLLRNKVGYTGVAITDDLNMDSVVSQRDKYTRALQAGHDMLLTLEPAVQVDLAIEEVAQATRSGRLRMQSIDERVRRIIDLKHKFGLVQ